MNEWVIVGIVAVLVLLFGAKKLPELARSVGRSTSEFKKGMAEGTSEAEAATPEAPAGTPEARPGTVNAPPAGTSEASPTGEANPEPSSE
jgi:sec-independent protein translocase protein TatA